MSTKRLATNISSSAGRVRELLTDLASVVSGNRATIEICDLREFIAAASDAALRDTADHGIEVVLDVPRSRMDWDWDSRSPAKLLSTTAATLGSNQRPVAGLLSAFLSTGRRRFS